MAKIRKRDNSYQIDYFDPNGKRVRKSFKKRKDAEAELGKRVSLIAEGRYLDVKKDYKTILGELLDNYAENYKHQAFFKMKAIFLNRFKHYFGQDTKLANIKYRDLESYRTYLRRLPTQIAKTGRIRTVASINREMTCLHHIFAKAVEWDMMEKSPFEKGKSLLMKENSGRLRYLDEGEIRRLLDNCVNGYTTNIIIATINTGMRRQEVVNLKWDQIRDGYIYLTKTKTDEPRQIPINGDLAELLRGIRQRHGLKSEYVFCNENGKPRKGPKVSKSFNASLKRAGITGVRFHDPRHTFASHYLMRGGTLRGLQKILGHEDIKTTMRYAHLSKEVVKEEINLLNGLTNGKCHKTVTLKRASV